MSFNQYSIDLEASSSQYAYIADNTALSITGDLTIEAWIKLEQLPSTAGSDLAIATKYTTTGNQRSYFFHCSSDNRLKMIISQDGTSSDTSIFYSTDVCFTSADVGKWVHVAVTVDISVPSMTFYKNGTALGTSSLTTNAVAIYDSTAQFRVGNYDSTAYFDGMISNLRVFNDVRTQTEIQDNMYSILTGTSNNLVGSWFNDANDYNDDAGTNNLTASGSPVFSTNVPWTGANSTDWTNYLEIKSDNTKVSGSSNLTDFPALISSSNLSSAVYAGLDSTGKDLRITTDSAGESEVPFEIVSLDTSGETCEIWAKVPTLSYNADTSLYIWYGNANAVAYDANAPFGGESVWTDYEIVWHDGTTDSTGNNTISNSGSTQSTGKIGYGANFVSASSQYINTGYAPSLTDQNFTTQIWQKTTSTALDSLFGSVAEKGANDPIVKMGINASGSEDYPYFQTRDSNNSNLTVVDSTSTTDGNWHYVVGVRDTTSNLGKISVNGETFETTADTRTGNFDLSSYPIYLGSTNTRGTGAEYLEGDLDEFRMRLGLLTNDWITTEYNNQNSPSTFWVVVGSPSPSSSESPSSSISPSPSSSESASPSVSESASISLSPSSSISQSPSSSESSSPSSSISLSESSSPSFSLSPSSSPSSSQSPSSSVSPSPSSSESASESLSPSPSPIPPACVIEEQNQNGNGWTIVAGTGTIPDRKAIAQTFQPSATADICNVRLVLNRVGSPSGYVKCEIWSDSGGDPDTLLAESEIRHLASDINADGEPPGYSLLDFRFAEGTTLTADTTYHIVVSPTVNYDEWDSSNYIRIFTDNSNSVDHYSRGKARYESYLSTWHDFTNYTYSDFFFAHYSLTSSESASPSPTPSSSISSSISASPSRSLSSSPSSSESASQSPSSSPSSSQSPSSSISSSPSSSPSSSQSPSSSPSSSQSPSSSISSSLSASESRSPSSSQSPSSSESSSPSSSVSATGSPSSSPSSSASASVSPSATPSPPPTCVEDQVYRVTDGLSAIFGTPTQTMVGQQFTVGQSGRICNVEVKLKKWGNPGGGNIGLSIYDLSSGTPNNLLCTSIDTYSAEDVALSHSVFHFQFEDASFLTASTQYAFVLSVSGDISGNDSDNKYGMALETTNPTYAGGDAIFNDGSNWYEFVGDYDAYFATYYDINSSPSSSISPSPSSSISLSPSSSQSPSSSPSSSQSPSNSISLSPSSSESSSESSSISLSPSLSPSSSQSPSSSESPSPSSSFSASPSPSSSPSTSESASLSSSESASESSSISLSPSSSESSSQSPSASISLSPSLSPSSSISLSPSLSESASQSPSSSISPSPSASESQSPSSSESSSQSPSSSASSSISLSPSSSVSASPSPSPSESSSPSSSQSPSPSPSASESASESASPSGSPSSSQSPSSSVSPSPSPAQYEDMYTDTGDSYTDKYSDNSDSYDDKYTDITTDYEDKYKNWY